MSKLELNELDGQELFSESENFLNELSEDELTQVLGGLDPLSGSTIGCAIKGSAASVVFSISQASRLSNNAINQGTVLFEPDDKSGGPGSQFTEADSFSFGDPGTF